MAAAVRPMSPLHPGTEPGERPGAAARPVPGEGAASPVVAMILLLAITCVLGAAVVLWTQHMGGDTGRPELASVDALDAPGPLTAATADGLVLLQHRGGQAVTVGDYTWTVAGHPVRVLASDGSGCAAEAEGWAVGEWVCLAEDGANVAGGLLELRVVHKATRAIVIDEVVAVS